MKQKFIFMCCLFIVLINNSNTQKSKKSRRTKEVVYNFNFSTTTTTPAPIIAKKTAKRIKPVVLNNEFQNTINNLNVIDRLHRESVDHNERMNECNTKLIMLQNEFNMYGTKEWAETYDQFLFDLRSLNETYNDDKTKTDAIINHINSRDSTPPVFDPIKNQMVEYLK